MPPESSDQLPRGGLPQLECLVFAARDQTHAIGRECYGGDCPDVADLYRDLDFVPLLGARGRRARDNRQSYPANRQTRSQIREPHNRNQLSNRETTSETIIVLTRLFATRLPEAPSTPISRVSSRMS